MDEGLTVTVEILLYEYQYDCVVECRTWIDDPFMPKPVSGQRAS